MSDALWIGILIVVTINLQRRLLWESERPVAIAIQWRLVEWMSWVLARVRRRQS